MEKEFHEKIAAGTKGRGVLTEPGSAHRAAFTLLEVMVACAVFFMVAFALLELVTRGLIAVRAIQEREPDPGIVLAMYSTNRAWEEMTISGNYEDIAPGMYPGYQWELHAVPFMETNYNLMVVDVVSYSSRRSGRGPLTASTLFFNPNPKQNSGLKGGPR